MNIPERNRERAFTMTELLVVVFAVSVMALMIWPLSPSGMSIAKAQRIRCVNNLKNVGLANRTYAVDHGEIFPWQTTNAAVVVSATLTNDAAFYFRPVTNDLAIPLILACPADDRKRAESWKEFRTENLSYFVGLDARTVVPSSLLAGDRNLTANGANLSSGLARIQKGADLGWDKKIHKSQGNIVMGDGSVQQFSVARFRAASRAFYYGTNFNELMLAVP